MVTIQTIERTRILPDSERILVEVRGLSTDTKPTEINGKEIDNGSTFIEMDTQKIFFYDLTSQEWLGEE